MSERPDMLSWLRAQVLARKTRAEALPHGPWHVEGTYPQQIGNPEAILIAETYTGPQVAPDIALHIVAHDPQDALARCEAELAILDLYERERSEWPGTASWDHDSAYGVARVSALEEVVLRLAYGYRAQPGWLPEWALETPGGG